MDSKRYEEKLNKQLNKFHKGIANVANTHLLFDMMKTAYDVMNKIKERKDRFDGEIVDVGSMAAHVPSVLLQECDFLYPIYIDGEIEESKSNPEYVQFKLSESARPDWDDCSNRHGYLNPKAFSSAFFDLVKTTMAEVRTDKKPKYDIVGKGTVAATIYYTSLTYDVSIDLVAAVRCRTWPVSTTPDWLQSTTRPWPEHQLMNDIQRRGTELVAKPFQDQNDKWRLSFSYAETNLIASARAVFPTFRKLLVIWKALRSLYLSPKRHDTTPILKSYHLKILLLQEALEFPEEHFWSEENLAKRFLSILNKLMKCTQSEFLPHLFMPQVNLFNYGIPTFLLRHPLFTDTLRFF